jgi:nucleoid DNA-binding protein
MKDLPTSISKRELWRIINKKINRSIHHYHVLSVITILFEEMLIDLKQDKNIEIFNFATISLQNNKPRKYYDIRFQQVMQSEAHRILTFILSPRINKKLRALLNLDKSLKND